MAKPTVTWKFWESTDAQDKVFTTLNYGSVQAGHWTAVKRIRANFSYYADDLRFWLNDYMAVNNGQNLNIESTDSSNGWQHTYYIHNEGKDPSDVMFTDNVKAGIEDMTGFNASASGSVRFRKCPQTEQNALEDVNTKNMWVSNSVGNRETGTGGDTDYIYLACRPATAAPDGMTTNWGFRLSFLYG